MSDSIPLTDDDVMLVLQAIRDGRVRGRDDKPYDADAWDSEAVRDGEAVRDWLERTHMPSRAREIVTTLKQGHTVKSRPVAPTVYIALQALARRIAQLEQEVAASRQRLDARA